MFKIITCIVLTIAFNTTSFAKSDQQHINELFAQAKKMMNFDKPIDLPTLFPVPQSYLKERFCSEDFCSAIYYKEQIIYDNRLVLRDPVHRSIILHELVHHIQRIKHGPTRSCELWFKNEIEAYDIQSKYLKQQKVSTDVIKDVFDSLKCPAR